MVDSVPVRDVVGRRLVLVGGVLGGLAATGCGSSAATGGSAVAPSGGASAPAGSVSAPAGGPVSVKAADVPVGGGVIVGKVVVTQPKKGEFKAFSAVCTHRGCVVAQVADGQIVCPCHGSRYAVADGSVVAGPAPAPLPAKEVVAQGSTLTVAG